MKRLTLKGPTHTLEGFGLFSAQPASVLIEPGIFGSGVVFSLGNKIIPANIRSLSARPVHPVFAQLKPRCTTVGDDQYSIATIEHVLSALAGIGVTDAVIRVSAELDHAEIPILDGSSKLFVDALLDAGTKESDEPVEPITVNKKIEVRDGDATIVIEPSDQISYTYTIDYPGTPIGTACMVWNGGQAEYIESICPARTFSLEHEANQMHAAGLFTHLTPRDMLVIGADGPIENSYRLEHECARHKLLDLIGDLALVGAPILAKITATRSGHALAHEAVRTLIAQSSN